MIMIYRTYLVCPNPQTCDGAFEWVEKSESEAEAERELIRKHRESEGRRIQEEEGGSDEEELNQDIRGFVLPSCDLFNDARCSSVDTSPTLTEVCCLLSKGYVSRRLLSGFEASLSKVILVAKCDQNPPGHSYILKSVKKAVVDIRTTSTNKCNI